MIVHIRVLSFWLFIRSMDFFFFGTVSLIIDSAHSIRILLIVCICEYE